MMQFNHLLSLDADRLVLVEERARTSCVVFAGHPLPRGCTPSTGRVGLERTADCDSFDLHVDRSVRYAGNDAEVSTWIRTGTRRFPAFNDAIRWLRSVMTSSVDGTVPALVEDVIDLDEVVAMLPAERDPQVDSTALLDAIEDEVIGQAVALRTIASSVSRHVARVHPTGPLTIMLLGPTGTGKTLTATELPVALSRLCGVPWQFARLDMAEFGQPHSASRLYGSPPGYVGYRDGRQLVDVLRDQQRSVILFDEIDKAHHSVMDSLINLIDVGRLAGTGRNSDGVDARQAIMLFTSNLDASELVDEVRALGNEPDQMTIDNLCRSRLRALGMRPETVARFAHFCVFLPLELEQRARVAVLAVTRSARSYGLTVVHIEPGVVATILRRANDLTAGTRGLEHVVDYELGEQFAAARRKGLSWVSVGATQPFTVSDSKMPRSASTAS